MKRKTLISSIILALTIVAGGVWLWQSQTVTASDEERLEMTGVIEARTVNLAPEVGGQVIWLSGQQRPHKTLAVCLAQIDHGVLLVAPQLVDHGGKRVGLATST